MTRLKESYEHGELSALLAEATSPTEDDVSLTADGQRLDTPESVIAFFEDMRAARSKQPTRG